MAAEAICALTNVLGTAPGHAHRAAASALGSLPIAIQGPKVRDEPIEDVPRVKWHEILEEKGGRKCDLPARIGRSLVVATGEENTLLVVKLACTEHSLQYMYREPAWMEHLYSGGYSFPVRFNIPMAIKMRGSYVFRLEDVPVRMSEGTALHPEVYAIGFIVHKDYFVYPNGHRTQRLLATEGFKEVMFRNAWLLGKLASLGIVHSAPIPLFHNRVQSDRRADHGLYEWPRRGRLDRWLHSCCYPNFGVTGIRDFEHLAALNGFSRKLHYYIGTQILSLLLVTGSYFRHKDRTRFGLDEEGNPVDARDLFDKQFLEDLTEGIFRRYYHGFVGRELSGEVPLDFDELSSRMIEEMGVDRHMEEILRVVDQEQMSDEGFTKFLGDRGYSEDQIRHFKKGVEDITIHTGPHLGGFNERISLPELIESVETMSALCIVGRYSTSNLA
ncbi:MAG: SidJ-related pseudokinase [Desulfobacterales bacterium]|nr:MAG: SidJ-related pseudokinase [Desulfobacterales bacterium]